MEKINIDGVDYVRADQVNAVSFPENAVMVRTYAAGVFYGELLRKESTIAGVEVRLGNARRVWYWEGAASLSQLATSGTSDPEGCKFPEPVKSIDLTAIEIIQMSDKALASLNSVEVWKA